MNAVESVHNEDGTLILMDMGSAVMTTEMVLEDLNYENIRMADCPVVEGAIAAAAASSGGMTLEETYQEALSAKNVQKF